MPDFDASNPYVREAVAAGVDELWIASFIRSNPGDYHRIMMAAGGDPVGHGAPAASSLTLGQLAPQYQEQVRPATAAPVSIPGAPLSAASLFGGGSPLLLVAIAAAAYYVYKHV